MPNFWFLLDVPTLETAEEADIRRKCENKSTDFNFSSVEIFEPACLMVFMIKMTPCVHLAGTWATAGLTCFSHLHMFHLYLNPQPAGERTG